MTIAPRYDTSDKPPRTFTTCEICLIDKDDSEFYARHPNECKSCLDDEPTLLDKWVEGGRNHSSYTAGGY